MSMVPARRNPKNTLEPALQNRNSIVTMPGLLEPLASGAHGQALRMELFLKTPRIG
jgi:hypothetical protein